MRRLDPFWGTHDYRQHNEAIIWEDEELSLLLPFHYDVRQHRTDWRTHCTPKALLVMVVILFEIAVSWHKIQNLQNVGNSHVRTFCLFLILLKPLFGVDKCLLHRNGGEFTSNATESASQTNVLSARYDWKQFWMSSASPTDLSLWSKRLWLIRKQLL